MIYLIAHGGINMNKDDAESFWEDVRRDKKAEYEEAIKKLAVDEDYYIIEHKHTFTTTGLIKLRREITDKALGDYLDERIYRTLSRYKKIIDTNDKHYMVIKIIINSALEHTDVEIVRKWKEDNYGNS